MGNNKPTRADWVQARAGGIGGSEIAAVLGLDPYCTPYQLWERKTGRVPDFEGNEATMRGKVLEPAIVEWFEQKTGLATYAAAKENTVLHHKKFDFLLGTPDRFVALKGGDGVLEAKSTRKMIGPDNVPTYWFFQLQWYLGITGKKQGFLVWLSGSLEFHHLKIRFDRKIFAGMVDQARAFWTGYVLTDTAPAPISREDIERMYSDVLPGTVEATPELIHACEQYSKNRKEIKELEEAQDQLAEMMQLHLKDRDTLSAQGVVLATWKESKREGLDLKAVQEAEPEEWKRLWKRYAKETKIRTLRVRDLGF